jgi:hypothetical protein
MAERQTLADFTEAERAMINDIYKREFQDMTPDEVQLYGEWQAVNARLDANVQARRETLEAEMTANVEIYRETEKAAIDTLEALKDLALARLKAVENGQA